jgi:hypothetical protein
MWPCSGLLKVAGGLQAVVLQLLAKQCRLSLLLLLLLLCCCCMHNGRALGYEPWHRGFNESWLPSDYIHLDNLMRWAPCVCII